jgi:hypothetical protein
MAAGDTLCIKPCVFSQRKCTMREPEEVFLQNMSELLAAMCEHGFELPFHCTFVDANGSMVYGRYDEQGEEALAFTPLTSHMTAEEFVLPMHVMLVEQGGESAHMTLDSYGYPSAIWN